MQRIKLYGGKFEPDNLNNPRTLIAAWVPAGARVLEVGPGEGVIGRWLKEHKGCHVTGVEFVPQAADAARAFFDDMIVGSIEDAAVLGQLAERAPFQSVIFADVLEHLVDPWRVVAACRSLLGTPGQVLISVPNVAHWSARLNLLRGRWDYAEGYLMDRTHLRWFTRRSARGMLEQAGYRIANERAVYRPRFMRLWATLFGFQIVIRGVPHD